jgi:hypothetical protein
MVSFILGYIIKNLIPLAIGAVGTLIAEHGVKWTVAAAKRAWGRNVSSVKDRIRKRK